MGRNVLEVVDVGFHDYAVHAVDILFFVRVKCELDVGLAELGLLVAAGSARMLEGWRARKFGLRLLHRLIQLLDQVDVSPAKKRSCAIANGLFLGPVPDDLLEVLEWIFLRQADLLHRSCYVEQAGQIAPPVYSMMLP